MLTFPGVGAFPGIICVCRLVFFLSFGKKHSALTLASLEAGVAVASRRAYEHQKSPVLYITTPNILGGAVGCHRSLRCCASSQAVKLASLPSPHIIQMVLGTWHFHSNSMCRPPRRYYCRPRCRHLPQPNATSH